MSAATMPAAVAAEARRPARLVPATARRVLFVEPNEDGTVGGSHQVLHDFALRMDRRRYVPIVVFYQSNRIADKLRAAGVEVHLMVDERIREKAVMKSGRRLAQGLMFGEAIARRVRFLRRHGVDLVHMNGTPQVGHDDWMPAARLVGIPAVANCACKVDREGRSATQQWFMRHFDRVLAVSAHIAAQIREFGYAASRVTTIHPGIDVEGFRRRVNRAPGELRAQMGVRPGTMLIVMVGNLKPWKGQHVALEALSRLDAAQRARVLLLVVGVAGPEDVGYEQELRARTAAAGLTEQVRFLGRREDVPDLMATADVVLHASVEPEPFGLVVIEGMALGRVVIASRFGGPAETLDSASGLTFSPFEPAELTAHLVTLLREPDLLAALGAAAQRRAERFDIGATVGATMRVYDELLGIDG